jgi:hypothetical protein
MSPASSTAADLTLAPVRFDIDLAAVLRLCGHAMARRLPRGSPAEFL